MGNDVEASIIKWLFKGTWREGGIVTPGEKWDRWKRLDVDIISDLRKAHHSSLGTDGKHLKHFDMLTNIV